MNLGAREIEQLRRSHYLFIHTQMSLDEISAEVGLDTRADLQILWQNADKMGLLDKMGL